MTLPARLIPARRVVVTGVGLVTCLGIGKNKVWNSLINGDRCGIRRIKDEEFPPSIPCKIAGYIPERVTDLFTATEQRHLSEGILYTLTAAEEALTDANWKPCTQEQLEKNGYS